MNNHLLMSGIMVLLFTIGFSGCIQQEFPLEDSYIDVSAVEAKELIEDNTDLIIIDVSSLYTQGHIPNSVNYYMEDGSLDYAIPNLNDTGKYLVYSHNNTTSMRGAQKLIDAGFKNAYRLKGNYQAWRDAGYETEKTYTTFFTNISPTNAQNLINNNLNLTIVDCRRGCKCKYNTEHIPNAIWNEFPEHFFNTTNDLLIYCQNGVKSEGFCQKLVNHTYRAIYKLEGGIDAWKNEGYET